MQRKAGGRIKSKYDHQNVGWVARGGGARNLDVCMEMALYKVKTKIDLYADLSALERGDEVRLLDLVREVEMYLS
jgi:hypothetical protein